MRDTSQINYQLDLEKIMITRERDDALDRVEFLKRYISSPITLNPKLKNGTEMGLLHYRCDGIEYKYDVLRKALNAMEEDVAKLKDKQGWWKKIVRGWV